jgi:trehalose 6-phosphate synthase
MLVTPLRDGMNLVAKEYVASRRDHTGTLILSEFTGAAHQLTQAVHVNPFDVSGLKTAIRNAVARNDPAARRKMASLARAVERNDAHHWATSFLSSLPEPQ